MLLFFFLVSIGQGAVVLSDLSQPRLADFGEDAWCTLELSESHYSWPANQPPYSWTRIMIPLALNASLYQITGCDANGTVATPAAYVNEAYVLRDYLYVSLQYWYETCRIFYAPATPGCSRLIFQGRDLFSDG